MTKFTTASGEVLTDEDIEELADEAERVDLVVVLAGGKGQKFSA